MKKLPAKLTYLNDDKFLNRLKGYATNTVNIGAQNLPLVLVMNDGQSGHAACVNLAINLLTFYYIIFITSTRYTIPVK